MLYLYGADKYILSLICFARKNFQSNITSKEKPEMCDAKGSLFYRFLKFGQIKYIFSDNVCVLYMYLEKGIS